MTRDQGQRWQERRVPAALLRIVAVAAPLTASFVTARFVARALPEPQDAGDVLMWWAVLITSSAVSLLVVERLSRRLLPLAALLKLALVFPDRAPSRYKIARASGNIKDVKEQLAGLRRAPDQDPGEAAHVVLSLVAALDLHDHKTRGHSERVRVYTDMIAEELGLTRAAKDRLRWAALLHDIGKLEVAADILNKDGKPDDAEWAALKRHPGAGAELANPLFAWLGDWASAIEHHHERYDGSGYPEGLRGEAISLGGRIVSVADAYETMTAARAYKRPMSITAARAELVASAGSHFDPVIVRAFLNVSLGKMRVAGGVASAIAQSPFAGGFARAAQQLGMVGQALAATLALTISVATGGAPPITSTPAHAPVGSHLAAGETPATDPGHDGGSANAPGGSQDTTQQPGDAETGDAETVDEEPGDEEPGDAGEPPSVPDLPAPAPAPGPIAEPRVAPVAADDVAVTDEDTSVTIAVAANDTDADGDLAPSSVSVTTLAASGTTVTLASGAVVYTPLADYHGSDTFAYEICDATGMCDLASVAVTIGSVPDAPVAADDSGALDEDGAASFAVLANDADVDGDLDGSTLAVTSGPTKGIATVDTGAGAIDFTPSADLNGSDSLTYQVCDATALCASATLSISIAPLPDDPVATPDAVTTAEDTPATVDVAANDSDVDGDLDVSSVTVVAEAGNGSAVSNGDGTVTYTPAGNFNGSDTISYTICDALGACDSASLAITVTSVNDAPIATDDSASTVVGAPVRVDGASDDADVDGNLVLSSVSIVSGPSDGSASPHADGTITYSPNLTFIGTDTFTYRVCDSSSACAIATVTVVVGIGLRAPTASADRAWTEEETTITLVVLANDLDRDGDIVASSVTIVAPPSSDEATATANATGTITYVAPTGGFHADDTFTYRVCDATGLCDVATVTVTVKHPDGKNDAPSAGPDSAWVNEDAAVVVDVLANDFDINGDMAPATLAIASAPANGSAVVVAGTIRYTPSANFNGTDSLTYRICDTPGACSTATVTVTVDPVDDPFTAVDDVATTTEDTVVNVAVLANDVDLDGGIDAGSVSVITAPASGSVTVNGDGTIDYAPGKDLSGLDLFVYRACALDGDCDTATVTVTVTSEPDDPVAAGDSAATPADTLVVIDVLANDSDPDGDLNPASLFVSTPPDDGSALVAPPGFITYTPNPGFTGTDTLQYTICDLTTRCVTASVTITVG